MASSQNKSSNLDLNSLAQTLTSVPNKSLNAGHLISLFRNFLQAVERTSHVLIADPASTGSQPIEARILNVLQQGFTGFTQKAQDAQGLSQMAHSLVEFATTFTHGFLKNAALDLASSSALQPAVPQRPDLRTVPGFMPGFSNFGVKARPSTDVSLTPDIDTLRNRDRVCPD